MALDLIDERHRVVGALLVRMHIVAAPALQKHARKTVCRSEIDVFVESRQECALSFLPANGVPPHWIRNTGSRRRRRTHARGRESVHGLDQAVLLQNRPVGRVIRKIETLKSYLNGLAATIFDAEVRAKHLSRKALLEMLVRRRRLSLSLGCAQAHIGRYD